MEPLKTYKVKKDAGQIRFKGTTYAPDAKIELTAKEAAPMLRDGLVVKSGTTAENDAPACNSAEFARIEDENKELRITLEEKNAEIEKQAEDLAAMAKEMAERMNKILNLENENKRFEADLDKAKTDLKEAKETLKKAKAGDKK